MKKQVEGHTSKQAPANRTLYHDIEIVFQKFEKNANPTTTTDFTKALKWYDNGNTVSIVERCHGFKMLRNKGINYTDNGLLTSMVYTEHDRTYKTINKKRNPLEPKDLKHIASINHSERIVCTF